MGGNFARIRRRAVAPATAARPAISPRRPPCAMPAARPLARAADAQAQRRRRSGSPARWTLSHRLAAHHRVRAARVVADHPAQRVVRVRRRVGREGQAMRRRPLAQVVEHAARLRPARCAPATSISSMRCRYLVKSITHGHVAALPAQAGAAAAREHGRVVLAAGGDRRRPRRPRRAGSRRRSAPAGSWRHRWRRARGVPSSKRTSPRDAGAQVVLERRHVHAGADVRRVAGHGRVLRAVSRAWPAPPRLRARWQRRRRAASGSPCSSAFM